MSICTKAHENMKGDCRFHGRKGNSRRFQDRQAVEVFTLQQKYLECSGKGEAQVQLYIWKQPPAPPGLRLHTHLKAAAAVERDGGGGLALNMTEAQRLVCLNRQLSFFNTDQTPSYYSDSY